MEDLLTCDECGLQLPTSIDGTAQCPRCGTELLASTGEFASIAPITERTLPLDRPSHAGEDAARIAMNETEILDLFLRNFGALGSVFVAPQVPEKKEAAARKAHVVHLPEAERVLALYDGSMLGSGEETGFILTSRRLCWKNANDTACSILWRDIDPDRLFLDGRRLFVDDEALAIADEDVLEACVDVFNILALSARPQVSGHMAVAMPASTAPESTPSAWFLRAADPGAPHWGTRPPLSASVTVSAARSGIGTPPPAHSASYLGYATRAEKRAPGCACWHCHTPLHATTPQCGYCGAVPKKAGWRKTG